ncbi:cytochrome c oxidase subunit 1 [Mortierella sp. GBA30]|nr:cytochrome c oxidase subunit 1 [Mortierella sp. GBA30]
MTARRLGGLYRLFQGSILLYIALSIIYQQRYLKTENIVNGAVRVTLKAPIDGAATPDYCNSTSVSCLHWDENDILYEPGVDGALVTTRTQITQYGPFMDQSFAEGTINQCDINLPTVPGCDAYSAPTTLLLPSSFVADIERFTLMLEHSIRGQASGVQMRSGNMDSGILRDSQTGAVAKVFTDDSRHVPAYSPISSATPSPLPVNQVNKSVNTVHLAGDVMTVGELLKAAGVSLDDLSGSPTATANETVRSSGVVIIVVIQYAAKGWNPNRISYEYLPKAIPDQEYKVIETIRDFRARSRVEINRHGIRIVFSQTGQLGQFSLMTLLTNLVAAIALFKVANIIVELLMLRLHPQKNVYVRAKFESTKDSKSWRSYPGQNLIKTLPTGTSLQFQEAMEHGSVDSPTRGSSSREMDITPVSYNKESNGNGADANSFSSEDEGDGGSHESTESEDEDDTNMMYAADRRDSSKLQFQDVFSTRFRTGSAFNSSIDVHRKSGTSLSTTDAQQRHGEKIAIDVYNWNRNGSSSALSGDITPGLARTTFHTAAFRHASDSDDVEIETPFGPVHPNSYKGFNPGGLSLNISPPLSQSSPQTRIAQSFMRGSTTPERQADIAASSSFKSMVSIACNQSPAAMQAVSPSPVNLGHQWPSHQGAASGSANERRRSRRSRRQDTSKREASPPTHPGEGNLKSKLSTDSLSSLTSSTSSSSLSSAYEGRICSAAETRRLNTAMNLGHCSGMGSSSTLSFGVPASPLWDYSSSCESITGSASKARRQSGMKSSSSPIAGKGSRKRRKECHQAGTAKELLVRSKSDTSLSRPIFCHERSSNGSSLSLAPSTSTPYGLDVKGKQRDQSVLPLSENQTSSTSPHSSPCSASGSSSRPTASTEAFNVSMTSFQLFTRACMQEAGQELKPHKQPISSSTRTSSSTSHDNELEHGKMSRSIRSSASSPCLQRQRSTMNDRKKERSHVVDPTNTCDTFGCSAETAAVDCSAMTAVSSFESLPTEGVRLIAGPSGSVRCSEGSKSRTRSKLSQPQRANSPISSTITARGAQGGGSFSSTATRTSGRATSVASNGGSNSTDPSSMNCSTNYGSMTSHPLAPSPVSSTLSSNATTSAVTTAVSSSTYTNSSINPSNSGSSTNSSTVVMDSNAYPVNSTYTHPTTSFFNSPITSSCTTTLAGTGIRVLGRTITMITADNKKLLLRRSEPLILSEGVGEEKAARM